MKKTIRHTHIKHDQRGSTLLELLVSLLMVSLTLLIATKDFLGTMRADTDRKLILDTEETARSILDLATYDIRMIGSGMPINQLNFLIGGTGLSDAPLPILTSSTATQIDFRINDKGAHTVLMADFAPSVANHQFTVMDAAQFKVGDMIYISDAIVGQENGLMGYIQSISGNLIVIQAGYFCKAGITLMTGSTVHRVRNAHLRSMSIPGWKEVTRWDESSWTVLSRSASFTVSYLDYNGNALAVPLTPAAIKDNLASISITLQVEAPKPLRDGTKYIAEAKQQVVLRNLIINR